MYCLCDIMLFRVANQPAPFNTAYRRRAGLRQRKEYCILYGTSCWQASLATVYFVSADLSTNRQVFLYVGASIVILVAVVRLFFELFQFFSLKLYYLTDWVNWVEVVLFACSIIFAFVYLTECLCPTPWQWQVGCIAVFLAWIDLIIFIRKIPLTGTLCSFCCSV